MLFGSAMDVIDRYVPDKERHAVIRGMLAFLAVNSTYRGPYTPGSATCLAFALAMPEEGGQMTTKIKGRHRCAVRSPQKLYLEGLQRDPLPRQGRQDHRRERQVTGVRLRTALPSPPPVVVSNLAPDTHLLDLVGANTFRPRW